MPQTHTRLLVDHFADCFRFYRDIIRLLPKWGDENSGYASFDSEDGQVALALFLRQSMTDVLGTGSLPVNSPGQDKFMLIFGVEDVDAEVRRIRQQGGEILMGPTNFPDWGYRGAYLRDPDGNLVEMLTGIPKEQWSAGLREEDEKYKSPPDAG
jgi:predicted enzyme related to lactoylglutathione lyase